MKSFMVLLFCLIANIWADILTPAVEYYGLERINWSAQPTDTDGNVRVGQYVRDANVGWDSEVLLRFDVSGIQKVVTDVEITLDITDANVGSGYGSFSPSIKLFEQNKGSWNSSTVDYDFFSYENWTNQLVEYDVVAVANQSKIVLRSSALTALVKSWAEDSLANNGLMLTGDFRYYDYFLNMDDISVKITTEESPVILTEVEETFSLQFYDEHWQNTPDIDVTQNTQIVDENRISSVRLVADDGLEGSSLFTVFGTENILNIGPELRLRAYNPKETFTISFAFFPLSNTVPDVLDISFLDLEIPGSMNTNQFETLTLNLPNNIRDLLNGDGSVRLFITISGSQSLPIEAYFDNITFPGSDQVK